MKNLIIAVFLFCSGLLASDGKTYLNLGTNFTFVQGYGENIRPGFSIGIVRNLPLNESYFFEWGGLFSLRKALLKNATVSGREYDYFYTYGRQLDISISQPYFQVPFMFGKKLDLNEKKSFHFLTGMSLTLGGDDSEKVRKDEISNPDGQIKFDFVGLDGARDDTIIDNSGFSLIMAAGFSRGSIKIDGRYSIALYKIDRVAHLYFNKRLHCFEILLSTEL